MICDSFENKSKGRHAAPFRSAGITRNSAAKVLVIRERSAKKRGTAHVQRINAGSVSFFLNIGKGKNKSVLKGILKTRFG